MRFFLVLYFAWISSGLNWRDDLTEIDLGKPQEEQFKACVGTHCADELRECGKHQICMEEQKTILMNHENLTPCREGYMGETKQECIDSRIVLQKNLLCWQENCYDWQGNLPEQLGEILLDCDTNGDDALTKDELYEGIVAFWKTKKQANLDKIYASVDRVWDDMSLLDDDTEDIEEIKNHLTVTEDKQSVIFRNNLLSKFLRKSGTTQHKTASQIKKEKRNQKRKERRRAKAKKKNKKGKNEL